MKKLWPILLFVVLGGCQGCDQAKAEFDAWDHTRLHDATMGNLLWLGMLLVFFWYVLRPAYTHVKTHKP